jgi:hypothetical protein
MNIKKLEQDILTSDFEEVKELTDKEKKDNAINDLYLYIETAFETQGYYIFETLLNNKNHIVNSIISDNNINNNSDIIYLKKQFDIIYKRLKKQAKDKWNIELKYIQWKTEGICWLIFLSFILTTFIIILAIIL